MNEKSLLEKTRKYSLWAVLGSAAILLVMSVLDVWDAAPTEKIAGDASFSWGDYEPTAEWWSRIEGTLSLILVICGVVLVSLLVASRVKRDDAAAKSAAPAKAPAASTAKKAPAKKPAAKK